MNSPVVVDSGSVVIGDSVVEFGGRVAFTLAVASGLFVDGCSLVVVGGWGIASVIVVCGPVPVRFSKIVFFEGLITSEGF